MDEPEPEPFGYTGFLIRRVQQLHATAWQRKVSAQVSSVQYGVLAILARRPGASQRELGDELDLDRSTVADVVARLERRGVVARERHMDDRRRNTLVLTDQGRAELTTLRPHVERVEHVLTDGLAPDDRAEFRRLLIAVLAYAHAGLDPTLP